MRDAVSRLGGDPEKINPVCPADLVIDHSIQVDVSRRYLGLRTGTYMVALVLSWASLRENLSSGF